MFNFTYRHYMPDMTSISNHARRHAALIQIQEDTKTGQKEADDIKHQEIVYYMHNAGRSVDHRPVDLFTALDELRGLECGIGNFIGFENRRTRETLQFKRKEPDCWYAEDLINGGRSWEGYVMRAYAETWPVFEAVKLFFEEADWRCTIDWKMYRVKGYGTG